MPKQAASGKTKVNAFIREFHNEFISTPTDLHAFQFHEDPCSISEYISNRLLGKDFLDIINCTRENITPAMFSQLQQCCATSCAVERSFSLLKKLLSKERNFLPDNLKKYFIFYYNHAAKEIQ